MPVFLFVYQSLSFFFATLIPLTGQSNKYLKKSNNLKLIFIKEINRPIKKLLSLNIVFKSTNQPCEKCSLFLEKCDICNANLATHSPGNFFRNSKVVLPSINCHYKLRLLQSELNLPVIEILLCVICLLMFTLWKRTIAFCS